MFGKEGVWAGKKRPNMTGDKHHFYGKKRPILSVVRKGKGNPNWKGGITKLRHQIIGNKKYTNWRTRVFKRDNYTCQNCGSIGGKLEAHHCGVKFSSILKKYDIKSLEQALKCRILWKMSNGLTLCKRCH